MSGPATDAARGWAAVLVLLVWVRIVPQHVIYGVQLHLLWAIFVAVAILGTTIGTHTGRYRSGVVFCLSALVLILAAALGHLMAPQVADLYLRLLPRRGPQVVTALVIVVALASIAVGRRRGRAVRPADLLVIGVVALFLVQDLVILNGPVIRDLRIYLLAGDRFFHGEQPYLTTMLSSQSGAAQGGLPFLYPPFSLPFFALISQLPRNLVEAAWLAFSLITAAFALRWLGIRSWWIVVLLLWPPIFQGLQVGNVAMLVFGLFAAAPRAPWTLPVMIVFKPQFGVPSIWLVRERRWRSLWIGFGLLVGVALLTFPIVGISIWSDWLAGLRHFQDSQARFHALYGLALPRSIPYGAFLLISVAVVAAAAILGRGRAGLARLGIASVVVSPSLYLHGFPVLLPALLGNGELVLWLGFAFVARPPWWILIVVVAAIGTTRFGRVPARPADSVHPLGRDGRPWSGLPPEPGPEAIPPSPGDLLPTPADPLGPPQGAPV